MPAKFLTIAKDKKDKHFVRLKNTNGEPFMHTESYSSRSNAVRATQDFEIIARKFLESKGYTVSHPTDDLI